MNVKHVDQTQSADEDTTPHVERQPVPGHTEQIPANPARDEPRSGPNEDRAPSAMSDTKSDTKPGTPAGTQSARDRLRTND